MKTFAQIGAEIGELVERKNAAYGSSFAKAGRFLALLYPDGLRPEQYADALLLVRIFDKQMRIATDRDALGESPYADIAGYGILGAQLHQANGSTKKEDSTSWRDNASGPIAEDQSKAQPASAARSTSERTTTSASATSAHAPLPQPDGCCEPFPDATAANATEAAKPSGEDHRKTCADYISLQLAEVTADRDRLYTLINTPSTADFLESVKLEAAHQRERWAAEHDAGKADADWFWLVGYLAGKVLRPSQTQEKRLHHIITTAAVCLNWHRHMTGEATEMRPGIAQPKGVDGGAI